MRSGRIWSSLGQRRGWGGERGGGGWGLRAGDDPCGAMVAGDAATCGAGESGEVSGNGGNAGSRGRAHAGVLAAADRLLPVFGERQRLRRAFDTDSDRSRDRERYGG